MTRDRCPECGPAGITWPTPSDHVRHHAGKALSFAALAIEHAAESRRQAHKARRTARMAVWVVVPAFAVVLAIIVLQGFMVVR